MLLQTACQTYFGTQPPSELLSKRRTLVIVLTAAMQQFSVSTRCTSLNFLLLFVFLISLVHVSSSPSPALLWAYIHMLWCWTDC